MPRTAVARRALVTGALGFVGSHLVDHLRKGGWTVHGLVRGGRRDPAARGSGLRGVKLHVPGARSDGLFRVVDRVRPQVVFHLATRYVSAHRSDQVEALVRDNILFGAELLDAMARAGVRRLVNAGTSWQHYRGARFDPVNLYAATKQAFEDLLRYYEAAQGMRAVTLVLPDTYGAGDRRGKILQHLVSAAHSGQALALSPGRQRIDLVHVDDACRAFEIAARMVLRRAAQAGLRFSVGSGKPVTLRRLVDVLESVAGRPVPVRWGGRPYRPREVMNPDCGVPPLPGWRPGRSLEDGLREIWAESVSSIR